MRRLIEKQRLERVDDVDDVSEASELGCIYNVLVSEDLRALCCWQKVVDLIPMSLISITLSGFNIAVDPNIAVLTSMSLPCKSRSEI